MRTLRRLVLCARPITEAMRRERERAIEVMNIPGRLTIVNEYRHVPDILKHLKLEKDLDLDEESIKAYILEPGYHNIHLILNDTEWKRLGIRSSLNGQSREIGTQIVTYGRWANTWPHKKRVAHKHPEPIRSLSEAAIGEWHELDHGLRAIWGIDPTSTHYHFYGYAGEWRDRSKTEQDKAKPRRYVRKPDVLAAWQALPWERLDETVATKLSIVEVLKKKLAELLVAQPRLVNPLPPYAITQKYGNYNPSLYPLTGVHLGVDHAAPYGTRIVAPADGEVTYSGYTNSLGHYVVYRYKKDRYLVALHLQDHPNKGNYKAGDTLGLVGDTGFIQGIHSHLEVWTVNVDRANVSRYVNKDTWRTVTRDPLLEF